MDCATAHFLFGPEIQMRYMVQTEHRLKLWFIRPCNRAADSETWNWPVKRIEFESG
jgi:hypothetical protein